MFLNPLNMLLLRPRTRDSFLETRTDKNVHHPTIMIHRPLSCQTQFIASLLPQHTQYRPLYMGNTLYSQKTGVLSYVRYIAGKGDLTAFVWRGQND